MLESCLISLFDLFRIRLEFYEQSCAVDSTTKKCAGPPAECRAAMLGILGTELRTTCGCKGTDFTQLYDCLGWQRLLWVNPCVVQSQSDFHIKNAAIALAQMSTTPATTMHTIRLTTSWRAEIRRTTILPTTTTTMATIYTEPTRPTTELIPKPLPKTTTTTTTTTSTVKPRKKFFSSNTSCTILPKVSSNGSTNLRASGSEEHRGSARTLSNSASFANIPQVYSNQT